MTDVFSSGKIDTVVLFTNSFPYGSGEEFLETELKYLARSFKSIIIVSTLSVGQQRKVPSNVVVEPLAPRSKPKNLSSGLKDIFETVSTRSSYYELASRPQTLLQPRALKRLASFINVARRTEGWFFGNIEKLNLDSTVFYSYWLGPTALALSTLKSEFPSMKTISRAHGWDVYEERHSPPYLPFRTEALRGIDHIYTVSAHGKNYLESKYMSLRERVSVARLGVNDPGFVTGFSKDNLFRVVSCSSVVPVKRLELLIDALKTFSTSNPTLGIEWTHIGGGPHLERTVSLAEDQLPPSVQQRFLGHISNTEVLNFYRAHPVDVFINVSSYEGVPVSIMEAQSCGIPVAATSVGGTSEIVDDQCGVLLPPNPTPKQIADSLVAFIPTAPQTKSFRKASKEAWRQKYNAEANYIAFTKALQNSPVAVLT
jgi:colanic acid/amylovoran biosynthesis glycosyltransferase